MSLRNIHTEISFLPLLQKWKGLKQHLSSQLSMSHILQWMFEKEREKNCISLAPFSMLPPQPCQNGQRIFLNRGCKQPQCSPKSVPFSPETNSYENQWMFMKLWCLHQNIGISCAFIIIFKWKKITGKQRIPQFQAEQQHNPVAMKKHSQHLWLFPEPICRCTQHPMKSISQTLVTFKVRSQR